MTSFYELTGLLEEKEIQDHVHEKWDKKEKLLH